MMVGTYAVSLILNTAKQSFQMTLKLMMMYDQIQFGSKSIRSSEDVIETVII